MRRRLTDEAGFTLVEALAGMVVGLAVLAAAMVVVGWATRLTASTESRVETAQRGREGIERVLTPLRSMTCVTKAHVTGTEDPNIVPMIAGTATSVEFYANTRSPDAQPQRRVVTYDATTRTLSESVYTGTPPAGGIPVGSTVLPIGGTATTQRVLEGVVPVNSGDPIFTYWTYADDGTEAQLAAPLAAASLRKVLEVRVNVRVRPRGATANSRKDAIFRGRASLRIADPINPSLGVSCV